MQKLIFFSTLSEFDQIFYKIDKINGVIASICNTQLLYAYSN
jgi:hypothetical protein